MKKIMIFLSILGFVCACYAVLATQAAAEEIYTVDGSHSNLGFKVKHLGISYVTGKFGKFDGKITLEGDQLTSVEGTVDVASIDTAETKRDEHLKSDDFFSADKFPQISFKSTKVTQEGSKLGVVGELTIRDVTKTVVLQGEWGGKAFVSAWNVHKAGLVLEGQINRKDFGLSFSQLLETGQAIVGDDIWITIELEANQSI